MNAQVCVLVLEWNGHDGIQVVHQCGDTVGEYEVSQISELCYPYGEGGGYSGMLMTSVGRKGDSVLAARRFGYTRRIVSSGNHICFCLLTRQHMPAADTTLTAIEDRWLSHKAISIAALPVSDKIYGLRPYGTLAWDAGLMGSLSRRFRSGTELRKLIGGVLAERRILFIGKDEHAVSRCVAAAAALPELAGLVWHHAISCCLPAPLAAYTGSPSPYIMGFHSDKIALVEEHLGTAGSLEELIVCDVDLGSVRPLGFRAKLGLDRLVDAEGLQEASKQFIREMSQITRRAHHSRRAALRRKKGNAKVSASVSTATNKDIAMRSSKVVSGTKAMASKMFLTARGKFSRGTSLFKSTSETNDDDDSGSSDDDDTALPLKDVDSLSSANKALTSPGKHFRDDEDDDDFELAETDTTIPSSLMTPKSPSQMQNATKDQEIKQDKAREECFVDKHYFSEEDDFGETEANDTAAFKSLRNYVRAIVNADNWLVTSVSSKQSDRDVLERARSEYVAASPIPEVAQEVATTQMFAQWVLDGALKYDDFRPDTRCWFQLVQTLGKYSDLDAALVALGKSLRAASDYLHEIFRLANRLWTKSDSLTNLNKVHAHRCVLRRSGSLLFEPRRALVLDAKSAPAPSISPRNKKLGPKPGPDSRLAASAIVLAEILSGPGAILATLRNELKESLRRAASSIDDPLSCSVARIALRLISEPPVLEIARHAFSSKRTSFDQHIDSSTNSQDRLSNLGGVLPTFSHLHVDHDPRSRAIADDRLRVYATKGSDLIGLKENSSVASKRYTIANQRHIIAKHSPHDLDLLGSVAPIPSAGGTQRDKVPVTHDLLDFKQDNDPFGQTSTLIASPINRPAPPAPPTHSSTLRPPPPPTPPTTNESPLLDFSTPTLVPSSSVENTNIHFGTVPSSQSTMQTPFPLDARRPPPPPPPLGNSRLVMPPTEKPSSIRPPRARPQPPPPPFLPPGGLL